MGWWCTVRKSIFIVLMLCVLLGWQRHSVYAQQQKTIIITEAQINAVVSRLSDPNQLKIIRADGDAIKPYVIVGNGHFLIFYQLQKTKTARPQLYDIWLTPRVAGGKISCAITKLQINDQILTAQELGQPNPFVTDLSADAYCNIFLQPFLAGYAGAQVTEMTLKNNMAFLSLSGELSPDAPPPAVIAGCKVHNHTYDQLSVRSGPDLSYPRLTMFGPLDEATLLGWQGDWVKVNFEGTVGWVWKNWVSGGSICQAIMGRPDEVWVRSDHP